MPKVVKPENEPRLQGESSRIVEWARRVTAALNPLADALVSVFGGVSAGGSSITIKDASASAVLGLDKGTTAGAESAIYGLRSGVARWQIQLGNTTAESGSNAGSDFSIGAYSDAGALLWSPLGIIRSTGVTVVNKGLNITAGGLGVTGGATINNGATINTFLVSPGATYVNPQSGIQYSPATSFGGSDYTCMGPYGDPGYGHAHFYRIYHLPGVWTGHQFYVAVGAGYTTFELRDNGVGYSAGGWTTFSDRNVKTNLVPVADALAKVATLTAYEFDRVDLKNHDGTPLHQMGLIAQDVQAVAPFAVHQDPPTADNPDPTRSLNYDSVTALAVQAINELSAQVAALRAEIQTLKGATSGGN